MFIERINYINNLGKFLGFAGSDPSCHFHKSTVIFAENGHGKSTLTDVIRSLAENDPSYLIGRKRINQASPPEIKLFIDGNSYNFNGSSWDKVLPSNTTYIFDTNYISDNLFTQQITDQHKTEISKIIIGKQGVGVAKEIEAKKKEKKEKESELKRRRDIYHQADHNGLEILEYINLPIDYGQKPEDIEVEIEEIRKKIKALENIEKIKISPIPEKLIFAPVNVEALKESYNKSIDVSQKEARDIVLKQIEQHHKKQSHSNHFIMEGLEQIKSDACPFCSQSLSSDIVDKLLEAYRVFFGEEYEEFVQNLKEVSKFFYDWNIEARLNELKVAYTASEKQIKYWGDYITDIGHHEKIDEMIEEMKTDLENSYKEIAVELRKKEENPGIGIDNTIFDKFVSKITALDNAVQNFNKFTDEVILKIEQAKENLNTEDLNILQAELKKYELMKKRITEVEKEFCNEYNSVKTEIEGLTRAISDLEDHLEVHVDSILGNDEEPIFERQINEALENLSADFKVKKIKIKTDGRKGVAAQAGFAIEILGETIKLDSNNKIEPNFKNTISAGDKTTLALALFLTSLRNDSSLSEALIVLDDPLSSLDQNRRYNTCKQLAEISNDCSQLIILSHSKEFILKIKASYSIKKITSPRFLQIKSSSDKSEIIPFDTEEEEKIEYHKNIDFLYEFIDGKTSDFQKAHAKMRDVIEGYLKFKFYYVLKGEDRMSKMVELLYINKKISKEGCEEISELCGLSNDAHHADNSAGENLISHPKELMPEVKRTLSLLDKI